MPRFAHIFHSLTTRLVLIGGLIIVFVTGFVLVSTDKLFSRLIPAEITSLVSETNLMLNGALAPLLFTDDLGATTEFLARIEKIKSPLIKYIGVYEINGTLYAKTGDAPKELHNTPVTRDLDYSQKVVQSVIELKVADETVGKVAYGISMVHLHHLNNSIKKQVLLIGAIGSLLTVGLLGGFGFLIYKRVHRLMGAAHSLAETGEIQDIEIRGKDEIGSLAKNFTKMARVIQERTRALSESEKRFLLAMDASKDGLYDWNLETNDIYYSPGWKKMLGYDDTDLPNDFSVWEKLTNPEDVKRSWTMQQDLISKKIDRFEIEFKMKHKNGHWVHILSRATAIFDESGKAIRIVGTHVDITKRKQEEERYRRIIQSSIDGFWVVDSQGKILDVNDAYCQMIGYSREELLNMSITEVENSESLEETKRHIKKIIEEGNDRFETSHRTKEGDVVEIEVGTTYTHEMGGMFYAFIRDITERKQAEEALLESNERIRNLVESTQDWVWEIDIEGVHTFSNDALSETLGYAATEIIGGSAFPLMHPDDQQNWKTKLPECVAQNTGWHNEPIRWIAKSGETRWFESSATPVCDIKGAVIGFRGIDRDITDRMRIQAALEKRMIALTRPLDSAKGVTFEDLFNLKDIQRLQDQFAAATGVASIITTTDGIPITRPSNFCRLCSDIIRKTDKGLANCFKSDAVLGRWNPDGPTIQPCLSGGLWDAGAGISVGGRHIANWLIGQVRDETQTDEQMRVYAKKIGAEEDVVIEAFHEVPAMSRAKFGEVAQALFTLANQLSDAAYRNVQQARFISEKQRAKEDKEKLESQLRQAQKMEAVGRLAGGVAHDFNNMLSVILGKTEMALEDIDPDQTLYADLEEIHTAARRSADLTRQLLAFARKQTVSPKVLDLNKTVAGMIKMLQRLIGEDIDLMWQPGDNVWPVRMDPGQIDQILANLCVNARDAITDVGKVSIETGNIEFDETYCSDHPGFLPGEFVLLAVSDNGCGMDTETQKNIFEPFFTTKETGQGTGLGLATVYGVVKQNNGFVNVYSEPGQGTTFNLYFPRHKTKVGTSPERAKRRPIERGHETILLVEDEISILKMTTQMLERLGYQVVSAGTPGEAIRLAKEYADEIHLLVTDVVMPEMNGRDLAKNILSTHPNLKRLFMSGYTANVIAHHGVLDEGVNFIQKPFSREQLGKKVREALDEDIS